jgi:hypothetical protein
VFAEKGFHVLAVDLLGFGFSDKPSWFDYSIASQARMIERLMDRLGIGRATLVGSSYGGAVASSLALDYAERVEKLVLVDAVINDDVKNSSVLKLAAIPVVGEILSPFLLDSKMFLKHRMRNTIAPENHHLITSERIESVRRPLHAVRVACSAGTYIRTLSEDIGKKLETGAHLAELRRTRAGKFGIEKAVTLEKLEEIAAADKLGEVLISTNEAVSHLPEIKLSDAETKHIKNGIKLSIDLPKIDAEEFVRLTSEENLIAVGVYKRHEKTVQPKVVLI